ncbi:MAG: hypothetical protein ACP5N3_02125 [Candidatus Nanoarchaeia archaeon]
MAKKKETELWEDFKMTEKEFDKYEKVMKHLLIDHETWTDLINAAFTTKEDKVKAWVLLMEGIEQGERRAKREAMKKGE